MKWADKCKELMFLALCDDQCATEFTQSPANWEVRAVQSLIVELWAGFLVQSWRLVAEGALSYFDSSSHFIVGLRNQFQVTVSKASKYLPFLVNICPWFNNLTSKYWNTCDRFIADIGNDNHRGETLTCWFGLWSQEQSAKPILCSPFTGACGIKTDDDYISIEQQFYDISKCQQFQNNFYCSWAP